MIALIQRVTKASVVVEQHAVATIDKGILALVGVQKGDTEAQAKRLCQRLLGFRIFTDEQGKMNLNVQQAGGEILLVPQFTLAADTRQGMRPSFSTAAEPQEGQRLFDYFSTLCQQTINKPVPCGVFGADMQVSLCNDGPVTFWLEAPLSI